MVRPNPSLAKLLDRYVCVRVTDMRTVDLARYRFDYDLTFAVLLMRADGTVYHRYGGRPPDDAEGWLSLASFESVLGTTLAEHAAFTADPAAAAPRESETIADNPLFAAKLRTGRVECVHCHNVHDARTAWALRTDTFEADDKWIWPDPARIGLEFDRDDQQLVRTVGADSAAAAAGLRIGDRVTRVGDHAVLTITDVQDVLDRAPAEATQLDLRFSRDSEPHDVVVELQDDWKRVPARDYAWRAFKWGLSPAPGFGGKPLPRARKRELGIDPDRFAFAIRYFVDWGDHAHRGRAAKRAGLRSGDIVYEVGGKSDFSSIDHFHAWVRLTRAVGDTLSVKFVRGREHRELSLTLPR